MIDVIDENGEVIGMLEDYSELFEFLKDNATVIIDKEEK